MTNINSMIERGQHKATRNIERTEAAHVAKGIRKHGDAAVVAVFAAVLNGEWDMDVVAGALKVSGLGKFDTKALWEALSSEGILQYRANRVCFSTEFCQGLAAISDDIIAAAPASMLPFTEQPKDWTGPMDRELMLPLIKVQGHFLEHMTRDHMPRVYAAVNRLQSVAFEINPALVAVLPKLLENIDPTEDQQRLLQVTMQSALLRQLSVEEELYFKITMDYRGRMYYRGGMVTPQGHDFEKAAFRFKTARPLGESGLEALAVHYANVAWDDKDSLDERISWAGNNGAAFAVALLAGDVDAWEQCDKPYQATVAAAEWLRVTKLIEVGAQVEDITSQLVCHQDGTCNGLQHGAALMGHRKTAESVNCIASSADDVPTDVYGVAADVLVNHLPAELQVVIRKYGRKCMKFPVMVTGYGAGTATAIRDMLALFTRDEQALFHTRSDDVEYAMRAALEETAGAMVALTNALRTQFANAWENRIAWVTEDGFVVAQHLSAKKTVDPEEDEREFIGIGQYRVAADFKPNEAAQLCGLSPNFVHSIDATHCRNVVRCFDYEMVTVHDSFGSHAGTYFEAGEVIREQFVRTHEYDHLKSLTDNNPVPVLQIEKGDYKAKEVLGSTYFFS